MADVEESAIEYGDTLYASDIGIEEQVEEEGSKINLAEAVIVLGLVGVEELLEAILIIFTVGFGIFIVEIMDIGTALAVEMYIYMRGGSGFWKLIVEPIGAIINGATAGIAPGKTVALGVAIHLINHPEKLGALEKVAQVAKKA